MKRLVVTILTVLAAAAPAWAGGYGAAVSRAAVPGCASCGQPAAQAYFAPAPAIQRTVDYAPVDTVSTQTEYVPVERQVVTRSYVPVVRDVAVAPSYDVCPPAAAPVYAPGCVPGRALAPGYGVGVMRGVSYGAGLAPARVFAPARGVNAYYGPGLGVSASAGVYPGRVASASVGLAPVGYADAGVSAAAAGRGVSRARAVERAGLFGHRTVTKSKAVVR